MNFSIEVLDVPLSFQNGLEMARNKAILKALEAHVVPNDGLKDALFRAFGHEHQRRRAHDALREALTHTPQGLQGLRSFGAEHSEVHGALRPLRSWKRSGGQQRKALKRSRNHTKQCSFTTEIGIKHELTYRIMNNLEDR